MSLWRTLHRPERDTGSPRDFICTAKEAGRGAEVPTGAAPAGCEAAAAAGRTAMSTIAIETPLERTSAHERAPVTGASRVANDLPMQSALIGVPDNEKETSLYPNQSMASSRDRSRHVDGQLSALKIARPVPGGSAGSPSAPPVTSLTNLVAVSPVPWQA